MILRQFLHAQPAGVDDRGTFVDLMLQAVPPSPPEAERTRLLNLGRDGG